MEFQVTTAIENGSEKNPPHIVEFQSDTKSLYLYSAVLVSIYNPIDVPVKFIDYTYN